MKMEQMGGGNNIKYTKVSETGSLANLQDVYIPDAAANKLRVDKRKEAKAEETGNQIFKSPAEKIIDQLLAKQLSLAELRKNRGDRTAIKALENEIQNIKSSPEYKNTLN
ncbi:MAG: hypothetical protein QG566_724 [Patescibacteria group bacterium]|jgi:hypothetical protein|nr:hypothetical protein [Patescibacteria group bacterium]